MADSDRLFMELLAPTGARLSGSRVHIVVQPSNSHEHARCSDTLRPNTARKVGEHGLARWRLTDESDFRAAPCARCVFMPNEVSAFFFKRPPRHARCALRVRGTDPTHLVVPGKQPGMFRLLCRRRVFLDGVLWVRSGSAESEGKRPCKRCERVAKSRWYRDLVQYADAMGSTVATVAARVQKQRSLLPKRKARKT